MKEIEYDLADVIIGRPHGFTVGRKHFYLYPVTLAKMFLLKRLMEDLGINEDQLRQNPFLEALRLVRDSRETCCRIMAYHTAPNTRKDLFDHRNITIRKNLFEKELTEEELASLLILALTSDKSEEYMRHIGLDEERSKLTKVLEVKRRSDKNTLSFNGKSVLGTFVVQLMEMGFSNDEVLYEKGYAYLRLMLADKVVTMHLTDEEMGRIPTGIGGALYDASNPENTQEILAMLKSRGVSVGEATKQK